MNVQQLNIDLCRALGIDTKDVRRVVLTIEASKAPTIEVERFARPATVDGLRTAVEVLNLVPRKNAGDQS